jgi:hypothetical protein
MGAGQQLGRRQAGAALVGGPFDDGVPVAGRNRIGDVNALATRSLSWSGLREENITGWPSLANSVPIAPPSRPAPMVAILIRAVPAASARAARGADAIAPSVTPPASSRTNARRPSEKSETFTMTISLAKSYDSGR